MTKQTGLIYIFTGDGKGKTSAGLGTAVRAVGNNMKVAWVAWYKESAWGISEYALSQYLPEDKFQMHLLGRGFHIKSGSKEAGKQGSKEVIKVVENSLGDTIKVADIEGGQKVVDDSSDLEHELAAQAALDKATELISKVDVLVLDEICNAMDDGLVEVQKVLDLLAKRGACHVVLTGRNVKPELIEAADLVSRVEKVKHPYDYGKLAVKGLDY